MELGRRWHEIRLGLPALCGQSCSSELCSAQEPRIQRGREDLGGRVAARRAPLVRFGHHHTPLLLCYVVRLAHPSRVPRCRSTALESRLLKSMQGLMDGAKQDLPSSPPTNTDSPFFLLQGQREARPLLLGAASCATAAILRSTLGPISIFKFLLPYTSCPGIVSSSRH